MRLVKYFPDLQGAFPWVSLIPEPTPIQRLSGLQRRYGIDSLWVKREDLTHPTYGGNKVRNLEFVLAQALQEGRRSVLTVVPYGSNFTGALAFHGRELGLGVKLSQFVVFKNPQIQAHAEFAVSHGAHLSNFPSKWSAPAAALNAGYFQIREFISKGQAAQWIPAGASNVTGALGHFQALFEAFEQCQDQGVPFPDEIIVGAGTCGTISGLLAASIALKHLNPGKIRTQITGVRAADPVVCNRYRIARLATEVLRAVGLSDKITPGMVRLVECPGNVGYGIPTPEAQRVIQVFESEDEIPLDTTYTAKVGLYLESILSSQQSRKKNILYWHTYCPNAFRWAKKQTLFSEEGRPNDKYFV